MFCENCGNNTFTSRGNDTNKSGIKKHRYSCKVCTKHMYILDVTQCQNNTVSDTKKYIVTSCQNNVPVNNEFLETLKNYCTHNSAELIVLPIYYNLNKFKDIEFEADVITDNFNITENILAIANLKISPIMENPLAGLEAIYKNKTVIVPSTQVRMRTLPSIDDSGNILITTGAITEPNFNSDKSGIKAANKHKYAATIIEIDSLGNSFIRTIEFDGVGFADIDSYYTANDVTENSIEALITGDEHVLFYNKDVLQATYTDKDSIVNLLKPKYIFRHDVIDSFSVSHHHKNNSILQYAKNLHGLNSIESELETTFDFIADTTPEFSKSILVSSNHNDHILKWLQTVDIKNEPWNAKIYHWFMYNIMESIELGHDNLINHCSPIELWINSNTKYSGIEILKKSDNVNISGINLSQHGDIGVNGSRGSIQQFTKLGHDFVIGHSHTPGIIDGVYQTGTSSNLRLEYNKGPSSWTHTHCIVHTNGKRQLITIKNSKWHG